MRVDWSTAEVMSAVTDEQLRLRVHLVDVGGSAYDEAFARETKQWGSSLGDERRRVERYSTGSQGWGIEVSPIDPDDIEGERRLLEEFVERVNRVAEPEQVKLDEADRKKRAEAEAREQRARELTERFRDAD